jgi:hypothetical protein
MFLKNNKWVDLVLVGLAIFIFVYLFIALPDAFPLAAQTKEDSVITQKEYTDMRVAEIQRATDKALESLNSRLSSMNEFRASITDANKTFATTETVKRMEEDIRTLRRSKRPNNK